MAQRAAASLAMPPKRPPDSLGRPLTPGRDTINGRRGVAQPAAASLAMPPKRPPDSLGRPLTPGRDTINGRRGVAQPGARACLGDKRSPVQIRAPRLPEKCGLTLILSCDPANNEGKAGATAASPQRRGRHAADAHARPRLQQIIVNAEFGGAPP